MLGSYKFKDVSGKESNCVVSGESLDADAAVTSADVIKFAGIGDERAGVYADKVCVFKTSASMKVDTVKLD